jgi:FlaG/FlaF family flagellin (archaellin)
MLMLVVTIIIAAVVSAMAGGIAGKTEKAPQASFIVTITTGGDTNLFSSTEMVLKHMGGDNVDTKDIQIITVFTNKSGGIYRQVTSRLSDPINTGSSLTKYYRVPYLGDMTTGEAALAPETKDFGNFTMRTGDVATTATVRGTATVLGLPWDDGASPTNAKDDIMLEKDFKPGQVVDVKILHVPSGKFIYDKKVSIV